MNPDQVTNWRLTLILVVVAMVVSAGVTRYFFPQIQVKTVEVTKTVIQDNVHTVTHIIQHPDGTKETVVDSTDKSTKQATDTSTKIIASKSQWLIAVGANTDFTTPNPTYELHVQRRILGPFYLGVRAGTDKSVGASIGMEL